MIQFIKAWNNVKDNDTSFGSKIIYLDERTPFETIESCKLKGSNGEEVYCTKIIYPGKFVIVEGTPIEFMQKLKDAAIAGSLLVDLYASGMTIKQFMQQNERLNGVDLS